MVSRGGKLPTSGGIPWSGFSRDSRSIQQAKGDAPAAVVGGLVASEPLLAPPSPQSGFALKQVEQLRAGGLISADVPVQPGYQDQGRDNFEELEPNPVMVTAEEPVSTFTQTPS